MKREYPVKTGFDEVPFPYAAKTRSQREEDDFMEEHGGAGSRACYCILEAIWEGGKAILRIIRGVIKLNRPKAQESLPISQKRQI